MIKVLFGVVIFLVGVISTWRMHQKAGQPGWVGLIPFVNMLGWLKMIGKPYWWIVLLMIPGINVVASVVVLGLVARSFGKSALFGLGMSAPWLAPLCFFIPFVSTTSYLAVSGVVAFGCFAALGLGQARYLGPAR